MKIPGRTIWDTRIQGVTGVLCARGAFGIELLTSATFAQVTQTPPRVIVNPNRAYGINEVIKVRGSFSINVMPHDTGPLVARLMRMRRRQPDKAKILSIEILEDERHIPYVAAAMRVLFCQVERQLPGGDRDIFLARVLESRESTDCSKNEPLLFMEVAQDSSKTMRAVSRVLTTTGLKDVIKKVRARLRPPPPPDIQATTYEIGGSTEEEIALVQSFGLTDTSRRLTVPARPEAVQKRLGVCVVGTHWGLEHCGWVRQAAPKARLFVCGRDPQRTAKAARSAKAEGYFLGLEKAISDERVDALSLALPHHVHREAVELVVGAGKPVLVEKPIATNLADADAMIAAADRAGVTLMVAENMHFRSAIHETVARIDKGDLGEPLYMLVHGGGIMRPTGWKRDKAKMGGGVLMDIGVHYIRAMRLIMGEPDEVFASRAMQINTRLSGEDSVQLVFSNKVGWEAHMLLSWASPRGTLPDIIVAGDEGTVALWPTKRTIEFYPVESKPLTRMLGYVRPHWLQAKLMRPELQRTRIRTGRGVPPAYVAQMQEFLACVAAGRPPATPPEDARRDLEIVLACYESLQEKSRVEIASLDECCSPSSAPEP